MDIQSLRLFVRVAEVESVSGAGHDLGISPASASARLRKLEAGLRFRLFHRTTRKVKLTTDGAQFLPYAQQLLESLDNGVNSVVGKTDLHGRLRITLPASFGRMYTLPLFAEFRRKHPKIELDLHFSDEVLDVVEGAYDLAIRNAALADSSLVSRLLAADERLLVASPEYLTSRGTPASPLALKTHECIVLGSLDRWDFDNGMSIRVPRTITANDGEAVRRLAEYGQGIAMASRWSTHHSIEEGRLLQVLDEYRLTTTSSIWAIYQSHHMVPPKVRAMLDFLVSAFEQPPWR